MRKPLILVLASVLFTLLALAGPLDSFGRYAKKAAEDWEVPGLAVAVVKDGAVAFMQTYGVRSLETGEPINSQTLFAIASTTKAMTAMAIGMLVDEGKLDWNDRVIDRLPGFRLHDPYVTREVRVRDLLTHNAGLGNADFLWYGQDTPTAEIIKRLRYVEPVYSLRSGFIYQNIMYGAAGELVGAVAGISWEEFLQQRLFDPLEMDDTVPRVDLTRDIENIVTPHQRIDNEIQAIQNAPVDSIPAAGAVWSSIRDMSRWIQFLLGEGSTAAGKQLVSKELIEEMFKPHAIVGQERFYPTARLTNPNWTTYGLGWFQHDYRGQKVDFHTGSIDGLVAIVGLIREQKLGICVLANLDHAEVRHALMYRVFDLYSDRPPEDWSSKFQKMYADVRKEAEKERKKREPKQIEGTEPSLSLQDYAGVYQAPLYGEISISKQGDGLRFRYGPGLQGNLTHFHFDTFRVDFDAEWRGSSLVTFLLDASGRPSRLKTRGMVFTRQDPRIEEEH